MSPQANPVFETDQEATAGSRSARFGRGVRSPRAKKMKVKNSDRHWWQYEITPKKVKPAELMNFSRQMASFVEAGIPLIDSLSTIAEDSSSKLMKRVLRDVVERVRSGERFSEAMSAHSEVFPEYYLSMLRSAELTGRLDETLDRLSTYLERDIEAKRRITSALTYPIIVGIMSVVTVVVLATFVLPRFKTFFTSLDAKLPLATRMLLAVTNGVTRLWAVIVGVAVTFFILLILGRKTQLGRRYFDALVLKLPQVGLLIRYSVVERFCRIMGSMVQAGVPLPDALAVASDGTNNFVFRKRLAHAREQMLQGGGLSAPIGASGLFPAAANQMLRVGEATGTLEKQLASASIFYERELNYRLKRFTDLFEPAIIVVVGFVVGFVAVALVSAMYGIYNQVQI